MTKAVLALEWPVHYCTEWPNAAEGCDICEGFAAALLAALPADTALVTPDSLAAALHSPTFRQWAADRLSVVTGMPVASVAAVDDIFADPADDNAKVITEGAAAIIQAAKEAERVIGGYDIAGHNLTRQSDPDIDGLQVHATSTPGTPCDCGTVDCAKAALNAEAPAEASQTAPRHRNDPDPDIDSPEMPGPGYDAQTRRVTVALAPGQFHHDEEDRP
jgi:hypothetical protein